ncbi:MAG TPA: hypothetical protein VKU19_03915 [Bryobacteraceae bacterium]|nr:hypothetical protein [Bryobacteraceae bacterium]
MIGAILRAQFLSMRVTFRRGAWFSAIAAVLWYSIWCGVGVSACILAQLANVTALERYLPLAFAGVMAYWQLVPVLSASMGAGLDLRKLRVYPIPHEKLFLVEVLLRLTTGAEMLLVLIGGAIGLMQNALLPGLTAKARLLVAVLIFVLFNLLLASGMRSLVERLLARRRVREILSFVLLMLYVVPRMLVQTGTGPRSLGPFRGLLHNLFLPWSAIAGAAVPPAGESGLPALAMLGLWTVVALWFGRAQFERNLRYDAVAAQATPLTPVSAPRQVWMERFYRWPSLLFRDPLAGLVEKELRTMARAPRFRMVFIMGFTFGLMVWFPMIAGRHDTHLSSSPYFLIAVCVYSMTLMGQVSYWNCFGMDRSATVFYFAAPQHLSLVLLGKNIAALFFIYLEVLVLVAVTMTLGVSGGLYLVMETLIVVGVCAVYLLGLGNLSSVHYPRALSPERTSQSGGSGVQGLLFLLYPLALFPIFLAYLARYAFNSEIAFVLVMTIAAAIGGILYWQAMLSSVRTAVQKREELLQELSKGDGPVTAN